MVYGVNSHLVVDVWVSLVKTHGQDSLIEPMTLETDVIVVDVCLILLFFPYR